MSASQKWIGLILAAFVLLFIILKIFPVNESVEENNTNSEKTNYPAEVKIDVELIIDQESCYTCHGDNFAGTKNAPTLKNLSAKYSAEALVSYLKNPVNTSKVEYSMTMPAVTKQSDEEIKALAEYLLKL